MVVRVEGSYKGFKGGFGVVKAFEGSLQKRIQQSGVGMEGPKVMLGRGDGRKGEILSRTSLSKTLERVQSKEIGR